MTQPINRTEMGAQLTSLLTEWIEPGITDEVAEVLVSDAMKIGAETMDRSQITPRAIEITQNESWRPISYNLILSNQEYPRAHPVATHALSAMGETSLGKHFSVNIIGEEHTVTIMDQTDPASGVTTEPKITQLVRLINENMLPAMDDPSILTTLLLGKDGVEELVFQLYHDFNQQEVETPFESEDNKAQMTAVTHATELALIVARFITGNTDIQEDVAQVESLASLIRVRVRL